MNGTAILKLAVYENRPGRAFKIFATALADEIKINRSGAEVWAF